MEKLSKYKFRSPQINNKERYITLSKFTWPFYVYQIAAPKLESIDVFGKLFIKLLLVNKDVNQAIVTVTDNELNRVKLFLRNNFSNFMSKELLGQIQDNLYRESVLIDNSIFVENFTNKFSKEMVLSSNLETITIYQDAITGEVAPHINEFNNINIEQYSKVEENIQYFDIKKPDIFKINKAYKLANIYNLSNEPKDSVETLLEEDFIFDESEADEQYRDVELLEHDSIKEINSGFDTQINIDKGIIFLKDYPERVNLEFEMIFDQVDYNIIYTSPFKEESDDWFTNLVSKAITTHSSIKEHFEVYIEECKEYIQSKEIKIESKVKEVLLTKKINLDHIQDLIEDNSKFEVVRKIYDSIRNLQLINDDAVLTKYGVFIEGLFDIMWQDVKNIYAEKVNLNNNYVKFKREISSTCEFYGIIIPKSFTSRDRYDHINKIVKGDRTKKPVLLTRVVMMLIADFYNIKNPLSKIIYDDKSFIMKINDLNQFRNEASHYSNNEVPNLDKMKNIFETIVIALMENTMKED